MALQGSTSHIKSKIHIKFEETNGEFTVSLLTLSNAPIQQFTKQTCLPLIKSENLIMYLYLYC